MQRTCFFNMCESFPCFTCKSVAPRPRLNESGLANGMLIADGPSKMVSSVYYFLLLVCLYYCSGQLHGYYSYDARIWGITTANSLVGSLVKSEPLRGFTFPYCKNWVVYNPSGGVCISNIRPTWDHMLLDDLEHRFVRPPQLKEIVLVIRFFIWIKSYLSLMNDSLKTWVLNKSLSFKEETHFIWRRMNDRSFLI